MKWFQGSITEAVTASKEKKAVFVVFVQGTFEFVNHIRLSSAIRDMQNFVNSFGFENLITIFNA